jgi:hypothetical protein
MMQPRPATPGPPGISLSAAEMQTQKDVWRCRHSGSSWENSMVEVGEWSITSRGLCQEDPTTSSAASFLWVLPPGLQPHLGMLSPVLEGMTLTRFSFLSLALELQNHQLSTGCSCLWSLLDIPAGKQLQAFTLALPRKSTGSKCSRYRLWGRKTSPLGTCRSCRGSCFWGGAILELGGCRAAVVEL